MASYYKVVKGKVVASMVADSDYLNNEFLDTTPGTWLTSPRNGTEAFIDGTYDIDKDKFIDPQPFASWTLNSSDIWEAPKSRPGGNYVWDESKEDWILPADYPDA
tara:strand:+ start:1785 stop:2099 length:315 start_codon:yes stop_codon:yes gene_type:complete